MHLKETLVPIAIDKIWAFMGKADVGKFVSALHGTPAVSSHFSWLRKSGERLVSSHCVMKLPPPFGSLAELDYPGLQSSGSQPSSDPSSLPAALFPSCAPSPPINLSLVSCSDPPLMQFSPVAPWHILGDRGGS